MQEDRTLKANDVFYLTPEKGNIHCFVAEENTIFIDISFGDSLYCNYYKELPSSEGKPEVESQQPEISQSTNDTSLTLTEEHTLSDSELELINTKKTVTLVPILPPYDIRVRMIHYQGESLELSA